MPSRINPSRCGGSWRDLGTSALVTVAILVMLEVWRPFFLLTDDNLIVAMNYSDLFAIENFYGYSPTAPVDKTPSFEHAIYQDDQGSYYTDIKNIFTPDGVSLIKKANPQLKFNVIILQTIDLITITLVRPDGTTVDLTPLYNGAAGKSQPE